MRISALSSGDLLREAVRRGDPLGKEAAGYMRRGALVPDRLVLDLILERLEGIGPESSFALDGFPRTREQAKALDEALAAGGQAPVDLAVDFMISAEKIIRRLAGRRICGGCGANHHLETAAPERPGTCDRCGGILQARPDDAPDTIRRRLEVYRQQIRPLAAHYRAQGKLRQVPGDLSIEGQYEALAGMLKREGRDG